MALRLISGKPFDDLIARLTGEEYARIMYLATRVKVASDYAKGDPNKLVSLNVKLSNISNQKLKQIAAFRDKSKEALIIQMIDETYAHLFPSKPKT